MVRETRHLWVGNLPENINEDRIKEHFKRYVVCVVSQVMEEEEVEEPGSHFSGWGGVWGALLAR